MSFGACYIFYMEREIYQKLLNWKNSPYRKPLIIKGARQVGKTYIITQFGRTEYEQFFIFNCDKDERIADVFNHGFRVEQIISDLEILAGGQIDPDRALIFIDEIGSVPGALAALKYFCEDAPQYHIIVAGSLLGLAIHSGVSFPVGKVDELELYPLSFPEFLLARQGRACYEKLLFAPLRELASLKEVFERSLREYYFTGGMPEIVNGFIGGRDTSELRDAQKRILADYAMDISKHASPAILGRIHQVWYSIPGQLAKANKKFVFGDIQKGARAKDFEIAITWLMDAGMIHKVSRVRKAGIPLKYYEDFSAFKLFLVDHGLMGAMVDAPVSEILLKKNVFEEYRGTFTEQYVLEQLVCLKHKDVFFFNSGTSKLELDFLIQNETCLVPIEVKAEENLRAKSLRQFHLDYPESKPVRLSMSDHIVQDWMVNLPLYAACRIIQATEDL